MYFIVAYPKISEENFSWIQGYRSKNDPRSFNMIKPHFTFVFGIGNVSQEDIIQEAQAQAKNIKKFRFELKVATITLDASGKYYHEYLVPEEGYAAIVKLHDKLYSDMLSSNLRFDISFIPHIDIGTSDDVYASKKRVDNLNSKDISIHGEIDILDILKYEGGNIATIDQISLD